MEEGLIRPVQSEGRPSDEPPTLSRHNFCGINLCSRARADAKWVGIREAKPLDKLRKPGTAAIAATFHSANLSMVSQSSTKEKRGSKRALCEDTPLSDAFYLVRAQCDWTRAAESGLATGVDPEHFPICVLRSATILCLKRQASQFVQAQ